MENSFEFQMNAFARRALEHAAACGVSPAEVSFSLSESFSARVREQKLEDYKVCDRFHLTLRGKWQGRIGTASTQAMDEDALAMLVQGVKESAELIETDEQDEILPPDERYGEVCCYAPGLENISAGEKIALAMRIDKLLSEKDARICRSEASVAASSETFALMNSLGLDLAHRSNMIYAYATALAKEGENAATGFKLLWGYAMDDVNAEAIADGCAGDALTKLGAGRLPSGARPVIIRNNAMADLLSTFSGVFSADNAQKGMSLLAGKENTPVASPAVTLADDPLMPWGLGSCPFDRDGAATMNKNVIDCGVLTTLLHNRKTAKKAGCATTGNAAGGGRVAPSNMYIRPGDISFDALLETLGSGLVITELSGLHAGANPVSGDFSLLSRGFEVENGKITRAVEQFTVAGNFYTLLRDITAVADDLLFEGSPIGSPSVAVSSLNIAGE